MNKLIIFLILLLVSLESFSQDAITRIKESGYLNVGILDESAYPFVYFNKDGNMEGFEVIRARQLADHLGADARFIHYSNINSIKKALENREIDISFHKRFRTLSDGLESFLTLPIAEIEMVLIVNRLAFSRLKLYPELKQRFIDGDFRVFTVNYENFIGSFSKEFPALPFGLKENEKKLLDSVYTGKSTGIYLDEASVKLFIRENPSSGITLRYLPLGVTQEVVGLISWKESFFRDWINIAIEGWGGPKDMNEILSILKGDIYE